MQNKRLPLQAVLADLPQRVILAQTVGTTGPAYEISNWGGPMATIPIVRLCPEVANRR